MGPLFAILKGLTSHCGVPDDQVKFLKWERMGDQGGQLSPPENGGLYTLPGAVTYDDSDVGLRIK